MTFDINAYIEGRLDAEEQARFEAELAQNPALQEELEQERELREHLAVMRVRSRVREAIREAPPEKAPAPAWRLKWWMPALVALLCIGGYWLWQTSRSEPAAAPETLPQQQSQPPLPAPQTPPANRPQAEQKPGETRQRPADNKRIAAADPANFRTNTAMERFIDGGLRSEALKFSAVAPANDAVYIPDEKGRVTIRFSGKIEGLSDAAMDALVLAVYNNRDANTPVLSLPLALKKDATGKITFDHRQQMDVPMGLYYFAIEEKEGGERMYVGRLFIGKLNR